MPFLPHVFTTLRIIVQPSILVPGLTVRFIANVDFRKLRQAGYDGVVVDRDNCLTKPRQDELVPSLRDAWAECQAAFGPDRVLIVSNSAGTAKDAAFLQAEALTRNLGAPVLLHNAPKPWVVKPIMHHFAGVQPFAAPEIKAASESGQSTPPSTPPRSSQPMPRPRLIVIGDRLSTDVVLASRLKDSLSIWTTKVWEEESFGVRVVRLVEDGVLRGVKGWRAWRRKRRGLPVEQEKGKEFVKPDEVVQEPKRESLWASVVGRVRGVLPGTS